MIQVGLWCVTALFLFCSHVGFGQKPRFSSLGNLHEIPLKPLSSCSDWTDLQLRFALQSLDLNDSEKALAFALSVVHGEPDCAQGQQVAAWCLFRNGQRREGMRRIDSAIQTFGPYPELVGRRALMAYEMLGTGLFNATVDGRNQYQGNPAPWAGTDSSFRSACLTLALNDFLFIETTGFADTAEFLMLARLHLLNRQAQMAKTYFLRSGPPFERPDFPFILQTYADLKQYDSLFYWANHFKYPNLNTPAGCLFWASLMQDAWPDSSQFYRAKANFVSNVLLPGAISYRPEQQDFMQLWLGKSMDKTPVALTRLLGRQPSHEQPFWWLNAMIWASPRRWPDLAQHLGPQSEALWRFLHPHIQPQDTLPQRLHQFFGLNRTPGYWDWAIQHFEIWGMDGNATANPSLSGLYLFNPQQAARQFLRWLATASWVQRQPLEAFLGSVMSAAELRTLAMEEKYSEEQIQQLLSRIQ